MRMHGFEATMVSREVGAQGQNVPAWDVYYGPVPAA